MRRGRLRPARSRRSLSSQRFVRERAAGPARAAQRGSALRAGQQFVKGEDSPARARSSSLVRSAACRGTHRAPSWPPPVQASAEGADPAINGRYTFIGGQLAGSSVRDCWRMRPPRCACTALRLARPPRWVPQGRLPTPTSVCPPLTRPPARPPARPACLPARPLARRAGMQAVFGAARCAVTLVKFGRFTSDFLAFAAADGAIYIARATGEPGILQVGRVGGWAGGWVREGPEHACWLSGAVVLACFLIGKGF